MADYNFGPSHLTGASILNQTVVRALKQVTLYELGRPKNYHDALLNPQSLSISVSVGIGKQYPIGASHSAKQYSHTEDPVVPLEFYVSAQFAKRFGSGIADVEKSVRWFTQFAYPRGSGLAPPKLVLIWPNVLTMAMVLESVTVVYERFQADLAGRAARISVQYSEIRNTLKTSTEQKVSGWISQVDQQTANSNIDQITANGPSDDTPINPYKAT